MMKIELIREYLKETERIKKDFNNCIEMEECLEIVRELDGLMASLQCYQLQGELNRYLGENSDIKIQNRKQKFIVLIGKFQGEMIKIISELEIKGEK